MAAALTLQDVGVGVGFAAALVSICVGIVTLLDRRHKSTSVSSPSERQRLAQEAAVALVDAGHALDALRMLLGKGLVGYRRSAFEEATGQVVAKRSSLEPIRARVRVVFGEGDAARAVADACRAMAEVEQALVGISRLRDPGDAPDHVVPSLESLFDSHRDEIYVESDRVEAAAADFARAVTKAR